uniref:DNA-directed DNA polymerase n=1 Tax=Marophrys sp. SRT127 TaxID=2488311 RepID=A0A455REC6_9EUKA|nr:DNA polymerase [Marophrys sp. SRT127]
MISNQIFKFRGTPRLLSPNQNDFESKFFDDILGKAHTNSKLDNLIRKINLTDPIEKSRETMNRLFAAEYKATPIGFKLRCLPTASLLTGGLIYVRAVSDAINVEFNPDNTDDPFNTAVLLDNYTLLHEIKAEFYGQDDDSTFDPIVIFRFWHVKIPAEGSDEALQSLRATGKSLKEAAALKKVSLDQVPPDKHLSLLPRSNNLSRYKPGEFFVLGKRSFKVAEEESFVLPDNVSNKYPDAVPQPTGMLLDKNNSPVLCFKDVICNVTTSANKPLWLRFVWQPSKPHEFRYYVYEGLKVVSWVFPLRSCRFVEPKTPAFSNDDKVKEMYKNRKFGVLDIETLTINGEVIPIAVGLRFGGSQSFTRFIPEVSLFYVMDFNGKTLKEKAKSMMREMLRNLITVKNRGYVVYAHNLSGFDGPLLTKYLADVDGLKVKPFMVGTKVYKLGLSMKVSKMDSAWVEANRGPRGGNFKLKERGSVQITLHDSYTIIPVGLKEAGIQFGVKNLKGEFPHNFLTEQRIIDNICLGPNNEPNWDVRNNLLTYLKGDLNCTYEVVERCDSMLRHNYNLNMHNHLTIASVVMEIFRTMFMKYAPDSLRIPILTGPVEEAIRQAFWGGLVNVFKPIITGGGYVLDVTSQYPAAMLNDMPVGVPRRCYAPILEGFFGFCEVEVESPAHMDKPFLPARVDGKVINPLGRWRGWYFSEVLKKAVSLGYKIKIYEAYEFDRGKDVFKAFVTHFFEKKAKAGSTGERFLMKIILNSFFGRWGMHDTPVETKVMNFSSFNRILNTRKVHRTWFLGEDTSDNPLIVEYSKKPDVNLVDDDDLFFKLMNKQDIRGFERISSVGIAAATTGYALISMYDLLASERVTYSDTDSLLWEGEIPESLRSSLGNELGKLKIEMEFDEGLFIMPKVYYLHTKAKKEGSSDTFKYAFKGAPRNQLNPQIFKDLYEGKPVTFTTSTFERPRGAGLIEKTVEKRFNPPTNIKRKMVFDTDGVWIGTAPYTIEYDRIIDQDIQIDKESTKKKTRVTKKVGPRTPTSETPKSREKNDKTLKVHTPVTPKDKLLKKLHRDKLKFEAKLVEVDRELQEAPHDKNTACERKKVKLNAKIEQINKSIKTLEQINKSIKTLDTT